MTNVTRSGVAFLADPWFTYYMTRNDFRRATRYADFYEALEDARSDAIIDGFVTDRDEILDPDADDAYVSYLLGEAEDRF